MTSFSYVTANYTSEIRLPKRPETRCLRRPELDEMVGPFRLAALIVRGLFL